MNKGAYLIKVKYYNSLRTCNNEKIFPLILLLLLVFQLTATCNPSDDYGDISRQGDTIRKTIPYTLPWDDMPIDLSFVFENEKPAGKHGFLKAEGDRFIFEDGTEAKFWGTNFNSAQNFPPHKQSEKVAKRLAMIGVNIVRFHQMDAEWSTPNIFQFTKGENKLNTMSFDPESMDRLDYLVYCLRQEGIYVYMDLLTYRRFKTGDRVESADKLEDAAKPYSIFDRRLIELQKKFNYDLWTHINPYTGLAYKEDPAIAFAAVTNENELVSRSRGISLEPYRTKLENLYRKWAGSKGIKVSREKVEIDPSDDTILQFLIETEKDYYNEMIWHMRETGVKVPISGTFNWGGAHLSAQTVTDYTVSNIYWGSYGRWHLKTFSNESMTGGINNHLRVSANRLAGKPFFVSEWDNPWPNEWRAEAPLLLAAAGSFQGWGGYCIHTYRYTMTENVEMIAHGYKDIIEKRLTSDAIAGRSHRGGVFDTFNDPALFGLFYHAALIMRRGDVRPAEKTVLVKIDKFSEAPGINALKLTPEKHRVEMFFPNGKGKGDVVVAPDETVVDVKSGEVLSDTRELYRNLNNKTGWIDSPNTKAVYGFVGKERELALSDLKINVKTDFATVAISTLTDEPIKHSTNMLLTAVGRADNTNSRYNKDHTESLEVGHGPIQVEVIEAVIEIKTDKKNLRAMSINPQGLVTGYMPSEYKDGVFRFEIGKEFQSMYYLIQEL